MSSNRSNGRHPRLVARVPPGPVYLVDAATNAPYVLLPAEDYQRVRAFFEADDGQLRETYPLQEQAARAAGWDDPAMDAYDAYDLHRNTR